jgi:hypothetical protein
LSGSPFRRGTAESGHDRDNFVGNGIQASRIVGDRNLAHTNGEASASSQACSSAFVICCRICVSSNAGSDFCFVSCNQPKADSNIDAHENDKRRANAKRHFPAARGTSASVGSKTSRESLCIPA